MSSPVTLALGFGRTRRNRCRRPRPRWSRPFGQTQQAYRSGWAGYDAGLRTSPASLRGSFYLSANVLKASEDKTFPGAIVAASLASRRGQSVQAGVLPAASRPTSAPTARCSARDLYEAFTGLLAAGTSAQPGRPNRTLFDRQRLQDGSMPRDSLLNGKSGPDTGGTQLDEAAYPILMAYLAGLGGDATLWKGHVGRAADSWSATARRSGWSAGRSRPATHRPRSRPRSPG